MFLRNVCLFSVDNTAVYHKRQYFSFYVGIATFYRPILEIVRRLVSTYCSLGNQEFAVTVILQKKKKRNVYNHMSER